MKRKQKGALVGAIEEMTTLLAEIVGLETIEQEKEPNLSIRRIADHFDGISKSRMAEILKEEGIR